MDEPIERPNIDELVGRLEDAIVLLLDDKDRAKALTVAVAVEDELVAHLDSSVGEDALSGEIPSLEKIGRGISARKIPRAKGPSEEQLRAAAKDPNIPIGMSVE